MSAHFKWFGKRNSVAEVEEGDALAPKFDEHGLLPAMTTAAKSGELLMLGYMNAEALEKTIATGEAHYWSRSRGCLGTKGPLAVWYKRLQNCG